MKISKMSPFLFWNENCWLDEVSDCGVRFNYLSDKKLAWDIKRPNYRLPKYVIRTDDVHAVNGLL